MTNQQFDEALDRFGRVPMLRSKLAQIIELYDRTATCRLLRPSACALRYAVYELLSWVGALVQSEEAARRAELQAVELQRQIDLGKLCVIPVSERPSHLSVERSVRPSSLARPRLRGQR